MGDERSGSIPTAKIRHAGDAPGPRAARTIAAILQGTREVFLLNGYSGTTIDDITRAAGVSRSSFYTYFPSKRDALLALGAQSLASALAVVGELAGLGAGADVDDLARWVSDYFGHLDGHGSFAFAWTQAAHQDREIRRAGQRGHLAMCRRLGMALARIHDVDSEAPTETGLLAVSMLERVWAYAQLYGRHVDQAALERRAVRVLWELERPPGQESDFLSRPATTGSGRSPGPRSDQLT